MARFEERLAKGFNILAAASIIGLIGVVGEDYISEVKDARANAKLALETQNPQIARQLISRYSDPRNDAPCSPIIGYERDLRKLADSTNTSKRVYSH